MTYLVKTCVHCFYIPQNPFRVLCGMFFCSQYFKDIRFYSRHGNLFSLISWICCFTSCTVNSGSSMYPVMLTLHALSKCSCKIVAVFVFSSWNCAIASVSLQKVCEYPSPFSVLYSFY